VKKKQPHLRKSLVLSFAQTYTSLVFNLLTVMIVSRLLTPKEIGIYSVAVGLAALTQMLREFGVSDYLVQEKNLHDAMVRTSFTVNLILAWLMAAGLFAASWLIGDFYGDDGVGKVIRVLSATFMLMPFGTTAMALLKREMAFGVLLKIRTGEVATRSGMTIGLAFAGFGYMSMAWASLASMLALILGCTIWGHAYRARGLGLSEWRRMVPFGLNRTISDIASQVGAQSANIVVGKMLGLAEAGFYSRGYGLVNLFRTKVISAISAVAYPAYAAEHREQGAAPTLYLRSLVYLTGISWPFFAVSAFMALPIIRIMFGDQWDAAVPLMRWLCAAAIVGTLIYQCNQFLVAVGQVGSVTTIEIQYQLARLALAIGAAFYSVEAVAASQILVYVIAVALYYRKLHAYEALAFGKCIRALIPSLVVTVTACVVPAAVALWPDLLPKHMFSAFAVAILGSGAGWLLGLMLVKHPLLGEIRHLVSSFRSRFPGFQR
jgi:O-antigen/teichoic acid export membrane protein